jgi:hypothetical protein
MPLFMRAGRLLRIPVIMAATILATMGMGVASATSAVGATAPRWAISSLATPTDFSTIANAETHCSSNETIPFTVLGEVRCDTYMVTATDVGSAPMKAKNVTIEDTLPAGLAVRGVGLFWEANKLNGRGENLNSMGKMCSVSLPRVTCTLKASFFSGLGKAVQPDDALKMLVVVAVNEPPVPSPLVNVAKVEGGEAPPAEASATNTLEEGTPPFGLALFSSETLDSEGTAATQAGSHPYELTTTIGLNSQIREEAHSALAGTSVEDVRDVLLDLPSGLAGSALATPVRCSFAQLASVAEGALGIASGCPAESQIGFLSTYPPSQAGVHGPIYNLVPEPGVVAEFGFVDAIHNSHVLAATLVPTTRGYVLRASSRETPQVSLTEIIADVYGDPAQRDGSSVAHHVPTLTMPADCSGEPLVTKIHMDSWQHSGSYLPDGEPNLADPNWVTKTYESPTPVSGCEALAGLFDPQFEAKPDSTQADSPTGLQINLKVPQSEGPETLGTPPLKDAVVALPEGITVNPSQANGLQACTLAQVGISAAGAPNAAPPSCPDASKIGSVELETPALPSATCKDLSKGLSECPNASEREKTPLEGSIYIAKQSENPFDSLLAIYIVVNDPRTGVIVKLPAEVKTNETTGQLTAVVRNSPQFPFSELRTHFFGGATGSLRSPATCGTYTLTSEVTPWSAPESGPPATPSSAFEITQGPGGSPCAHSPGEEPNAPSFQAGTQTPTAAAYSPVTVHLDRGDGSQNFSQISVTLPPGVIGKLAGIPRCSDAQIATALARSHPGEGAQEAANPSCPASSAIGTVTVGTGAGPSPFYVTGEAYLAGPYKGAPFSAVFITPAIAGPFDLGVVVVRAGLYIDPNTAQVTTKADPLPTILQGIPLDVRSVSVDVDRPQFTLNPTNCTPMAATGQETSTQGQTASLSERFQVGGCQSLPFHPSLTASVASKASKANGTTFAVNVTSAGLGQANIAKVYLQLPKALPSRLSTIQKACLAAVFDANPATCPAGSVIGTATVHTPLLDSPVSGPAYLVSHGGAAFPDVEFVLQGEGVTLVLDGKTLIKNGVTYSRFEAAPDAPLTAFETVLPAGPHSALTAIVPASAHLSLCGTSLAMPTEITGQNGAVIKQNTKIAVTGCPKTKALTRAQKLAAALKACKKKKSKSKRAVCQKQAHKKYGPVKGKKRSTKR